MISKTDNSKNSNHLSELFNITAKFWKVNYFIVSAKTRFAFSAKSQPCQSFYFEGGKLRVSKIRMG